MQVTPYLFSKEHNLIFGSSSFFFIINNPIFDSITSFGLRGAANNPQNILQIKY